jgi:histidinol phosphatase-like enzyme
MNLKDLNIDKSWAMFLDRDGVINNRIIDDYIKRWEDFKFIDGVLEAMQNGGRIDKIYFSPYLEKDKNVYRKPGIGMALQAKNDFPSIDFTKSIMVGDSITDMQFGKNAGMLTVFISGDSDQIIQNQELIDFRFKDLYSFAETIKVNETKIIQGEAEV